MSRSTVVSSSLGLLGSTLTMSSTLLAGTAAVAPTLSPAPEPRIKLSAWIAAGITVNPSAPDDNQNFGRFFDDRSNEPVVNQIAVNLERALAPQPGEWDWGFKLQFIYGSDARFIHGLGLFDHAAATSIMQPDLVEAYLNLHLPVITAGGLDVKLGKWVTLEGVETIDPRTDLFYSHTYIFNFGIPFDHLGAVATLHATEWLDLIAGITRGVNTAFDDNNDSAAFHGGFGITLNDGKLLLNGSTHIGPETPDNNRDLRYLSDIFVTWKITDKWTSITEVNFARDDATDADGYGGAQYLTCAINENLTANLRGEIWRDDNGFYVASFADPHDPIRSLGGQSVIDPRTVGGGRTTYGAITFGLDLKPRVPKPFSGLTIRPELRYDRSLNKTRPFNDSHDRDQFTFGTDCLFTF